MTPTPALDVEPAAVLALLKKYPRRRFDAREITTMLGHSLQPADNVHATIWACCMLAEKDKIKREHEGTYRTLYGYEPPKDETPYYNQAPAELEGPPA